MWVGSKPWTHTSPSLFWESNREFSQGRFKLPHVAHLGVHFNLWKKMTTSPVEISARVRIYRDLYSFIHQNSLIVRCSQIEDESG